MDALKKFIEETVKEYWLETKRDENSSPRVYEGYLPQKKKGNMESEFPFVLLRLLSAGDDGEFADVHIKIIVGTYSKDDIEGWKDTANILQRIYQELGKKGVLENKYRVERPIRYTLPEEQPYPEWFGEMETKWTIARPITELDY